MECLNILINFLFRMKQKYHNTNEEAILILKKPSFAIHMISYKVLYRRNFTAIREHSDYLIIDVIN